MSFEFCRIFINLNLMPFQDEIMNLFLPKKEALKINSVNINIKWLEIYKVAGFKYNNINYFISEK